MSQVTWQEPPPRPVRYDWTAIAALLQRKPGQWALIYERDRVSVANAVRQGDVAAVHPDLGFEVRTANTVQGVGPAKTCSLYMRWNPS